MAEPTLGVRDGYGKERLPGTRIDVAKRELLEIIDALDLGCLLNVVSFDDSPASWSNRLKGLDDATRKRARTFVERLGAGGGTNLFGALEEAFDDANVDTIYVLSDGEPTTGTVLDPALIREHVRTWNRGRGVVVHCVAVGGDLALLEWLAEDTGGSYIRFD